jgi:hypothetical protein
MGNNILDDDFINNEVIPTLVNWNEVVPLGKSEANLTFKKYLVSILQNPQPNGDCWYDLIESLPKESFNFQGNRARS